MSTKVITEWETYDIDRAEERDTKGTDPDFNSQEDIDNISRGVAYQKWKHDARLRKKHRKGIDLEKVTGRLVREDEHSESYDPQGRKTGDRIIVTIDCLYQRSLAIPISR